MSDLRAKMHQIPLSLGWTQTKLGELTAEFKGPTSKKEREREGPVKV